MTFAAARMLVTTFLLAAIAQVNPSFHDPHLNFTYSNPPHLLLQPTSQSVLDEQSQTSNDAHLKHTISCITIPLSLKSATDKPYVRLLLVETDFTCLQRPVLPNSLLDFTQSTMTDLMKIYGPTKVTQPRSYTFDHHPAMFVTAISQADAVHPGLVLYAGHACVEFDKVFACWNILSSTAADIPNLFAQQLKLDGLPAFPLVPATLTQNNFKAHQP